VVGAGARVPRGRAPSGGEV